MNFLIKKVLPIFLILFSFAFVVFFFFSKKITPQKIENKINQTVTKVQEIKNTIVPEPTKILSSGLPNKHLIQTAFVEQAPEKDWAEPWQDACEEASLLTVEYYYKNLKPTTLEIKNDILKMIDFENAQGFGISINVSQMAVISEKYLNYKTKIIDNPTVEDIKKYISEDIPVVVPASGKTLFKENTHFKSGGPWYHAVVILGYDDTSNQFIVHDVGTQFGAYFHYSYSLLMESIHDFPASGIQEQINTGSKRVLILLK